MCPPAGVVLETEGRQDFHHHYVLMSSPQPPCVNGDGKAINPEISMITAKNTLTENASKGQGKGTPSKPGNLENSHFTPVKHHRIKPQSDQQRPRGEPKL